MTPGVVLLGFGLLLPPTDSLLARAESLLAAGQLQPARAIAERLLRRTPDDVRTLILLGRIHLEWPVIGRYRAETLLSRAARLAPSSPEPLYYLGRVGLALGGDDGETIARPALVRMLALEPEYRDGWTLWLRLYRDDRGRRDAVAALERHAGSHVPDVRRALLLIELRHHDSAVTILDRAIARRPLDPLPRALLARAHFEAGRDSLGAVAYDGALRLAHRDSEGELWLQVRSIASPGERSHYEALEPQHREGFFRQFWVRREPNLFTTRNERLGEHFRRYADARRGFALLHPNARYQRSSLWRRLAGDLGGPQAEEFSPLIAEAMSIGCGAGVPGLREELAEVFGAAGMPSTPGEESPNAEDGLDDRGRIWVWYGRPEYRYSFGSDGETWCYRTLRGMLRVTFLRRTGGGWGASGDLVVTPLVPGEAESVGYLLATDQPTLPPEQLAFRFWPATFRAASATQTEVVLFPDSVTAIAVLVNEDGREVARDSATHRPLRLVAAPGRYLVLLDGVRGGRTGSYRGSIPVPSYQRGVLSVSGLLLADGATAPSRAALEAAAPPGLVLLAATPLRVYAEVYGLAAREGVVMYDAEYRFERLDGSPLSGARGRITTISFRRELPAAESHVESVVIDPGRLPRGRYRVQLDIRDPLHGATAASTSLEFRLR